LRRVRVEGGVPAGHRKTIKVGLKTWANWRHALVKKNELQSLPREKVRILSNF
jgi:hypothetical protein